MLKGPKGRDLEILEFHTPSRVPKVTSDKIVGPPTIPWTPKFVVNTHTGAEVFDFTETSFSTPGSSPALKSSSPLLWSQDLPSKVAVC